MPDPTASEYDQVLAWRWDSARALGYTPDDCWTIARGTCDLHELAELLARGCPSETALRIVDD